MTQMTLQPDSWKSRRKKPAVVTLTTLGNAPVILRPMSALRKLEIEKVVDDKELLFAVVADTAVSGEVNGDEVVSLGGPIWTKEEIVSEEFPAETLVELIGKTSDFLNLRSAADPNR